MQLHKTRNELMFILNPALFIVGIIIFYNIPHAIPLSFRVFWVGPLCVLWLILSPIGKRRLAHHSDDIALRLPWQQWFFCIALLELALVGAYLGIASISGTLFAVNAPTQPMLFETSLHTMLVQYGLFPWCLYALIAVGMGIIAYHDQAHAYFSNLLKPITKQDLDRTYSLITNIGMRRAVVFAVSTMLMFMTMLLISLLLPLHINVSHGFEPAAILTTLVLLCLSYSDTLKPYIMRHFSRRIPTYLGFPVFCTILAIIIVFLSLLCKSLWPQKSPPSTPELITHWISYDWSTAWIIFSVFWWACMTPLVGTFIARVSRGYRIREVLIGVLLLPTALTAFFIFQNPLSFSFELTPVVTKIIALISFLILLPMLVNHKQMPCAITAYLPKNGVSKLRDYHLFFMSIIRLTIMEFYFYLVIGVNGLSILLFAPNYVCIITLFLTMIAVVKHFYQK